MEEEYWDADVREDTCETCKKCDCICKVDEETRLKWCAVGKAFMNSNPAKRG